MQTEEDSRESCAHSIEGEKVRKGQSEGRTVPQTLRAKDAPLLARSSALSFAETSDYSGTDESDTDMPVEMRTDKKDQIECREMSMRKEGDVPVEEEFRADKKTDSSRTEKKEHEE